MLGDSYLLVALAIEICRDLSNLVSERRYFQLGPRYARWLNGDPNLAGRSAELVRAAESAKKTIAFDVAERSGVDREIYIAADRGDREAMKRVLSSMWTSEARPEAVLSDDWRPWLLNAIGSSSGSRLPDALGAIDKARHDSRLSEPQAAALLALIERFVGPGEIEPEYAEAARRLFEQQDTESAIVDLFLLYDRVASGHTCNRAELEAAAKRAAALGSPSASAYFLGVAAERALRDDRVEEAYDAASRARALHAEAAAADPTFANGQLRLLFLVAQIANRLRHADEADGAIREGMAILEGLLDRRDPGAVLFDGVDLGVKAAVLVLMSDGRHGEARALYGRAETILDRLFPEEVDGRTTRQSIEEMIGPPPVFPEDVDAITRYGSDQLHEGHLLSAIEWLGEGAARHEALGDKKRRCGVLGDLAVAFKNAGNWARADAIYHRVIDLCRAEGDDTNLSRWTQNMGVMLMEAGELEQSRRFFEEGLAAAERSGSAYQISCAHGNLGVARVKEGDIAGAADAFDKALQTSSSERLTEQWCESLFSTLAQWGTALMGGGDIAAAIAVHERLIAAFDAHGGDPSFPAMASLRLAALLCENLHMAEARAAAVRARELFEAARDENGVHKARALEEQLARSERDVREVEDMGDPAAIAARIDAAVAEDDVAAELTARTELVFALSVAGSPEMASAFDAALERAKTVGERYHEMNLALNFAPAFLRMGEVERALALARRAEELAEGSAAPFRVIAALHLAQVFDEGLGDAAGACAYYGEAVSRLASLMARQSGDLPNFLRGERATLARGVELVMEREGASPALQMLEIWDPATAASLRQQLRDGDLAAVSPIDPRIETVLAAWRSARDATVPAAVASQAGEDEEDDPLARMARFAEIAGWTEAAERLARSRCEHVPPREAEGAATRLVALVRSSSPDAEAVARLGLCDDDLVCLFLFAMADRGLSRDGTAFNLLRLSAKIARDDRVAVRALNFLGMFERDPEKKLMHYGEGAARLADGTDDRLRAHLLVEQASVLLNLQRFREAQEIADMAIEVAERVRADNTLANARGNLAIALLNQGEPARALEIFEELADFQERMGEMRGLENTRTNIAVCRMRLGDAGGESFDVEGGRSRQSVQRGAAPCDARSPQGGRPHLQSSTLARARD
jgi:tetratricopeptide (TPR) repeat protein